MKKFLIHKGLLATALSFLAIIVIASPNTGLWAQFISDFSVQLSPESPGPYQNVTATLVSYSVDLDRVNISWSINGEPALSGVGKKVFSFTTGDIGASSRVTINVADPAGTINKTITVIPGSVDLLWQVSDAYAPPFYRGKALPAPQSTIKIVAMPNIQSDGSITKPSLLVYKWTRNYKADSDASGYGKNIFSFKNSYLDPEESIQVSVTQASGEASAEKKISIATIPPFVLFYENNPLQGVFFERALGDSFSMSNNEMRVDAEPYFFSSADKQNNIMYSWQLNGSPVSGSPDDPSSLVLRNQGGKGTARVSLSVTRPSKIMQSAGNAFSVNFGK